MVLGLKTTSFTYYYNIFTDMLKSDKSYDSLPNFSAADGESLNLSLVIECAFVSHSGVRLLGIGRNQYIDLMNQSRSKVVLNLCTSQAQGLGLFRKRVNPRQLLPAKAISPTNMSFWWEVHLGFVSEEDIKVSSSSRASHAGMLPRGALVHRPPHRLRARCCECVRSCHSRRCTITPSVVSACSSISLLG
jgi:hypothetical protein